MSDKLYEIPLGWSWVKLSDIADIKGGLTKGKKRKPTDNLKEVPYLRVANVQRGYLMLDEMKTIKATEAEILQLLLEEGDILFTEGGDRDKLGRGWIWLNEIPECIHQNHVFRARLYLKEISSKLISLYSNSNGQNYFLGAGKQTTNLASINLTKLSNLPIPIPPFNEQRRIVARIEALTARSRRARQALAAVPQLIDQFRQSVLAAAFRGDLTAEWRQQHPDIEPASALLKRIRLKRRLHWEKAELEKMRAKGKEPRNDEWKKKYQESESISIDNLSILPHTWLWTSMGSISEIELGKMLDKGKEKKGKMLPYLRNQNVQWFDFDLDEVFEMDFSDYELERFTVQDGDILVCEGGEPGRSAIWSNKELEVKYQKTLHRVRLFVDDIPQLWIVYHLKFESELGILDRYCGGSTIKHLTKVSFQKYPVPLPPIEEQKEIVKQIEIAFNIAENIEHQILHNLEKVQTLDQSILAKAFRGELVPQDPDDEPASVLLERIRAERERLKPPKQKGRSRRQKNAGQLPIEGLER